MVHWASADGHPVLEIFAYLKMSKIVLNKTKIEVQTAIEMFKMLGPNGLSFSILKKSDGGQTEHSHGLQFDESKSDVIGCDVIGFSSLIFETLTEK